MRLVSALCAVIFVALVVTAASPAIAAQSWPDPDGVRVWRTACASQPQSVAIGRDGRAYVAAASSSQIFAFNRTSSSRESWQLQAGTFPRTLAMDANGRVYFASIGGAIGRLDPQSGEVQRYTIQGVSAPYWVEVAPSGRVWFSDPIGRRLGAFEPDSGDTTFFDLAARPYAISIDSEGRIWSALTDEDSVGVLNPRTGLFQRIKVAHGSRPSAIAAAPDGMIWSVLPGSSMLLRIDGHSFDRLVEYRSPPRLGALDGLAISADGTVWVSYKGEEPVWRIDHTTRLLEEVNSPPPSREARTVNAGRGAKLR